MNIDKRVKHLLADIFEVNVSLLLHSWRVALYSDIFQESYCRGIGRDYAEEFFTAALLHDVGKIKVPKEILDKPCKLTQEEYQKVCSHPLTGFKIIKDLGFSSRVMTVILYHHEREDSTGYPCGLRNDEIPFEAKIVGLADAYDAMTSFRPYREMLSPQEAVAEIRRFSGQQFNRELAEKFCDIVLKIDICVNCFSKYSRLINTINQFFWKRPEKQNWFEPEM